MKITNRKKIYLSILFILTPLLILTASENTKTDIAGWISSGQKIISETSVNKMTEALHTDKTDASHQQKAAEDAINAGHTATMQARALQDKQPDKYYTPAALLPQSIDTKGLDTFEITPTKNFSQVVSLLQVIDSMRDDISQQKEISVFLGNTTECHKLKHIPLFEGCCARTIKRKLLQANKCSDAEYRLATAKRAERTHYIGSYCAKRASLLLAKSCVKEAKVYCVFSSRFARIVQESARQQLQKMFDSQSSEAQNTLISTVHWPYQSPADRWYRLPTKPAAVAAWSGAFRHHTDKQTLLSTFFAICQRGTQCGVLPQLTSDELAASDEDIINGWLIKQLPITVSQWKQGAGLVWLKGQCQDTCRWQIKQVGEAGYPDVITDDVQWQLFLPFKLRNKTIAQSGYSQQIITTGMGIQIHPFLYADRAALLASSPQSIRIKIRAPSKAWQEITLPITINKSAQKLIYTSPKIALWGGCQLSTGQCHYWLASRVLIKPLSWGTAKHPNCRGLTPQELLAINWHHIDFDLHKKTQ